MRARAGDQAAPSRRRAPSVAGDLLPEKPRAADGGGRAGLRRHRADARGPSGALKLVLSRQKVEGSRGNKKSSSRKEALWKAAEPALRPRRSSVGAAPRRLARARARR